MTFKVITKDIREVIVRVKGDIASEERDSGGPDDGNPWHTFTTRISDVKLLIEWIEGHE